MSLQDELRDDADFIENMDVEGNRCVEAAKTMRKAADALDDAYRHGFNLGRNAAARLANDMDDCSAGYIASAIDGLTYEPPTRSVLS